MNLYTAMVVLSEWHEEVGLMNADTAWQSGQLFVVIAICTQCFTPMRYPRWAVIV